MGDSVFVNGRAAVHKTSAGKSTAFPDVCLCPPTPPAGPVPVPLPNTVLAADLANGATSVLIEDNPAGTKASFFAKSTGNETSRPTGGGVVTHAVQGKAHFQSFSMNVTFEGKPAVRHLDLLTHNHLAQPGNTPPAVWTSTMLPPAPSPPQTTTKTAAGKDTDWIDIEVIDEEGKPVSGMDYEIKTASGETLRGGLLGKGIVKARRLPQGQCVLSFPELIATDLPPPKGNELPKGATPYERGKSLKLVTGKAHRVCVPGVKALWILLPINPHDTATWDDRIILRDDAGGEVIRSVKDDHDRGDDGLTLCFTGLRRGRTYTLLHDAGAEGTPRTIFEARAFEVLFPDDLPEDDSAEPIVPEIPEPLADLYEDGSDDGWIPGALTLVVRGSDDKPAAQKKVVVRQGDWSASIMSDACGRIVVEPPNPGARCEVEVEGCVVVAGGAGRDPGGERAGYDRGTMTEGEDAPGHGPDAPPSGSDAA